MILIIINLILLIAGALILNGNQYGFITGGKPWPISNKFRRIIGTILIVVSTAYLIYSIVLQ